MIGLWILGLIIAALIVLKVYLKLTCGHYAVTTNLSGKTVIVTGASSGAISCDILLLRPSLQSRYFRNWHRNRPRISSKRSPSIFGLQKCGESETNCAGDTGVLDEIENLMNRDFIQSFSEFKWKCPSFCDAIGFGQAQLSSSVR